MNPNYNNTLFLLSLIIWLGISLSIGIAISLLLPFPISLVVIIGVFISLNLYMRRRYVKQMGKSQKRGKGVGLFGSMPSSPSSSSPSRIFGESPSLKYYCMGCGTQHKDLSCPSCGSKMKKVGY